jgi:ATP-dependent RNA helicase DDX31/DBP7
MAEDGILLNFTVEDNAVKSRPKFRGGSWKDRMIAKKVAHHRRESNIRPEGKGDVAAYGEQEVTARDAAHEEFPNQRPTKRRRESGTFTPASTRSATLNPRPTIQDRPEAQNSSKPREVISSLFSYNPKPSSTLEIPAEDADQAPAQPSNAPLVDGMDTFISLGLSPVLASHLLTKMELKTPTAIQKASIPQLLKEDSDAFIQSETGSGKTLAYLLPLVQRIMTLSGRNNGGPQSTNGNVAVRRDSGLFAIILSPTRELCKQISVVLERLLGCAHWIVAGTVIGGEKKKSEKARLRKGLNVLVATPGRLADHLDHTKVLDIRNVRWLVLDEGDRLMDLGFEDEIQKIVRKLDERQKDRGIPGLPTRRTTILCSATMKMNVQRLGEISLKDAVLVKADVAAGNEDGGGGDANTRPTETVFSAPAQLKQSYTIAAAKLRLVTLAALLKRTFARKGSVMKAIVFVSCADSVEFHFAAFTRTPEKQGRSEESNTATTGPSSHNPAGEQDPVRPSPILSTPANLLTLYKLHGSLPQSTRTAIVKQFSHTTTPSLLIATDVASRGLDLPNLDLVIEYDPAFSSDDHLHRIGRTARLGRDGRAIIFLLPGAEEGYVEVLKSSYKAAAEGAGSVTHTPANEILKKGFSPSSGVVASGTAWEQKATDFQLDVERWVLSTPAHAEMAKRAFQSHVRAYATHVAAERKWFDIKELHLGHLAKAFGLRDAPGRMNVPGMGGRGSKNTSGRKRTAGGDAGSERMALEKSSEADEAAKKMREKIRNRKMMMGAGADEFNIA